MRIFSGRTLSYPEDPTRYFNFARFEGDAADFILCEGYVDFRDLASMQDSKIVYLEFDEPNRFLSSDPLFNHVEYEDCLYRVFTICPFTADWLNSKYGNKRTPVFFPFNEQYIPSSSGKAFDVIYTGHILSDSILSIASAISNFNYRFVSNSKHELVTNHCVSYLEKLYLVSKSRIAVVHNLLYPNKDHISNIIRMEDYQENKAFGMIMSSRSSWNPLKRRGILVPHLKSRLFEAAFCRSLIVCRRDPWNLVERFFRPEREFVYYEPGRLEVTIRAILDDYRAYEETVERAFERAVREYTTEAFFNRYLRTLA